MKPAPFLILVSAFFVNGAHADTWGTAPAFYSQYATVGIEPLALGNACEESIPDQAQRPCNPALATYTREHEVAADIILGGDYSRTFQYAAYLNQNDKIDLAQSILSQPGPNTFSGFVSAGYTAPSFNVWATPLHAYYFDEVRNSVSPEVSLVAMQEASVAAQYGVKLDHDFNMGLQVAGFNRRFVATQGGVFDFIADAPNYLGVKTQNGVFFEPGFAYVSESPWHFRLTGMVKELGFVDQSYAEIPTGTNLDFGTGLSIPFDPEWGKLDLLVNATAGADEVVRAAPVRIGATYKIGDVSSFVGCDSNNFSLGANVKIDALKLGLMFQQWQIDQAKNSLFSQVSFIF